MLFEIDTKQKALTLAGIISAGLLTSFLLGQMILQFILMGTVSFLCTGDRPTFIFSIIKTIPRDVRAAVKFLRLNAILFFWERNQMTVPKVFEKLHKKHPNKVAFLMDNIQLTFTDVQEISNRVGVYFKSKDFKRGDTVALLMETKPEYACVWLGLAKLGVVTALINTNLRKETLLHSIKVAGSKAIIVGCELAQALSDILNEDDIKNLPIYQHYDQNQRIDRSKYKLLPGAIILTDEIDQSPPNKIELDGDIAAGKPKDKLVYIYTSGTTGMPKAAVITNLRYMFIAIGCTEMLGLKQKDVIYNALPLYHTAGGMVGVGNVLLRGLTMAMRTKFSASNFWSDCIRYKCTVAQYIGELCRYLLSAPARPDDTQHNIRMMFGNGLRPQIWKEFVSRFEIPQIGELYGSTEGNSNLVNIDSRIGAVGFVPRFASKFYPVTLVRCDEDTGEPIRDSRGFCARCEPGQVGVFVGQINPKRAVSAFSGYADEKASKKKVLRNVFVDGDAYFDSGDILVMDILGYFYFKDRLGDTFRWRGENVATSEVEAVISNVVSLQDCVVYGVEIPNVEGKAGMAAIVDQTNALNMEKLSTGIKDSLPLYARPLFLRVLSELPLTGTFKLKKRDLQLEGFDLKKIKDALYFLNPDGIYRRFTEKDYDDVVNGKARL